MANENTLPISVVIDPSKAEAQMREFTRTAESIFAASEARKVQQTSDSVNKVKQVNGEYQDWWKRSLGEQDRFEKVLRQAQIEDRRRDLLKQLSDQKSSAAQAMQVAREGVQFEKMLRQAQLEDNRRMLQRQVADAKAAQQQIASAHAATPQGRLEGLLGGLGVKTPQQNIQGIKDVQEALKLLADQGIRSGVVVDQLSTKMRLLETGNARGRGEFHKMTAALASLTFEVTGAVYGFTALAGIITAPAMFGTAMLKRIEDARTGVTGILLSMGTLNGKALEFGQAWAASGEYVKAVQADSMKYGIDMGKLMEVNQAAMSGGLNAMLNLEQIQKVATAGAVAVSSLGLSSQQYVQEVRDLISGGIQPASSTLARSIGVTDALLKAWKAEGPDKLVGELTKRLQGFMVVADEVRSKTLTGAWDILQARIALLLSNEEGFGAIKKVVMDVANFIGTVDVEGKFIFNKDMLSTVKAYWEALMSIGKILKIIGDVLVFLAPLFGKIADAMRILETEFQIGVLVADQLISRVIKLATMDFKGAFSTDKTFITEMARLKGEVTDAGRSFAGLGEEVTKVNANPIDWKKITGNPDFADPKKGAKGTIHQSVMEQVKLEMEAKVNASEKELSNVDRVNLAWQKLFAEKFKHLKLADQVKELTQYGLATEAAKLADIKEAHEKIMDALKREKEHYDKLAKKEPTQIETIQEDIKVREERLKVLKDEIELRNKLATAPTDIEKSRMLGRMDLFAEAQKSKFTVPTAPRGRSIDMFAATGGSSITEATQTVEDLYARAGKKLVMGSTEQLRVQAIATEEVIRAEKLATINLIGNETRKIEEETAKIGLTRSQLQALEIGKIEADINKSNGDDKLAYEDKLSALRKKYLKEDVDAFTSNFKNVFSDALQPGVNFMQKLSESFVSSMRKAITDIISQRLFESMLKPALDAFANSMKGAAGGVGSLFSPTAGGMGLGGGALLPQLGLALGAGSLLKSAFGHGPTQFEDSRLVGTVGGAGFQGRREQSWTEKGGFLTSDNRGTIISAVLMPEIRKLNDTINNLKVTFSNFGSAVGIWGLGVKDFEFAINAAGDATNAIADGIGNALVPALKMFQIAGETLADTAKRLTDIFSVTTDFVVSLGIKTVDAFGSIGIWSANARKALTDAAGGADVFSSLFSSFSSSILTDADRVKIALDKVGSTFAELNVHGVDTKEKFADLVKAETEAGHWDIVTKLLSVSDAFGQVVDSADKARKASEDLAKTHYKSALDAVDVLRKFAADTRDFMKSLWGGAQAPSQLSSGARRGEFLAISQLAGAGDIKAQGQLQSSATGLLDFAKTQARTSLDYARSFAFVQTALDTTASTIENTVSAYDALLAEVAKANPYLADIAANTSDTKNNIVELAIVTATLLQETMTGKPISESMAKAIENVKTATKDTLDILTTVDSSLMGILTNTENTTNAIINGLTNLGTILQRLSPTPGTEVSPPITVEPPTTVGDQIETVTTGKTGESAAETAQTKAKVEAYDKWMAAAAVVDQLQNWWASIPQGIKSFMGDDLLGKYNGQLFPAQAEAEKLKAIYDELPPKFALGGTHMGGYRIVGENGPELEYTGPSHITSNADTRALFNIEPMVNEIKELRAELRALGTPLVQNTRDTAKQLIRWDGGGLPETRIVTV